MEKIDVLIIGAGPIGLACGIEAKRAGLTQLIIDKGSLVNSIFNYPLNMTFFSTSEKLEIGNVPFVSSLPKPTRTEALEYYRRVALQWELSLLLYTSILGIERNHSLFEVSTSKGVFGTKAIVVATGFYDIPQLLGVEGEEMEKVHHYYKEPHPFSGQHVAVIGAANSAVDAALETYRKGSHVTLIVREEKISERVKYWVKPDIENRIKEGSINAYFNARLKKINKRTIEIETSDGVRIIDNDFVLAMTGYKPDFGFLEQLGIIMSKDADRLPYYNPLTMETNVENLYLAGVICGGLRTHEWFIENSRVHAKLIFDSLTSKSL